jgi:hypothetical protein
LGLSLGCHETSPGTFGMFTMSPNYEVQQPTSQYFAGQLITKEWVQPGSGEHKVFSSASDVRDDAEHILVTSYAVLRPDGEWSLMIVNKDQLNPHSVHIVFNEEGNKKAGFFSGTVNITTFGTEQYQWHSDIGSGVADPDGPPARSTLTGAADTIYKLPKASVTIIRGTVAFAK